MSEPAAELPSQTDVEAPPEPRASSSSSLSREGIGTLLAFAAVAVLPLPPAFLLRSRPLLCIPLGLLSAGLSLSAAAWTLYRRRRTWEKSLADLARLVEEVSAGAMPMETLSEVPEPFAALAAKVQGIFREMREQGSYLAAAERELHQRVAQRTDALERMIGSLKQQASRDALTGLYNRRMLNEHLPRVLAESRRNDEPLSLMMLDLDHFKGLNDTLGHAAGDEFLKNVGQIIRSTIRDTDLAFRCGGDEFVVLLPGTPSAASDALARRLTSLVDGLGKTYKLPHPVGVSVGVVSLKDMPEVSTERLLELADQRLYALKKQRKSAGRRGACETARSDARVSPAIR